MLYAVRGNKQLKIDDSEKESYLKLGYDIAKADGDSIKTIIASPAKTVPYAKHKEALDEIIRLKKEVTVLKKAATDKAAADKAAADKNKGGE